MDIYSKKSLWKLYLGIAGLIIVLITMAYANYLTDRLAQEERMKAELWVLAQEKINDPAYTDPAFLRNIIRKGCPEPDVTLHLAILQSNNTIPVVVQNDRGGIDFHVNFRDTSEMALKSAIREMEAEGQKPIAGYGYSIYYKESKLLQQLRFFPIVQLILIGAFIAIGYTSFNSARRAEQNRVWVGMAKETAHQLGTPISAIVAWIEHLKAIREEDEETQEILGELRNDVSRLELIADRFSKIGSAPSLEPTNVYQELEKCRDYMQRRASRRVAFHFPDPNTPEKTVRINPHLFDWVIENILRNALDAMDGKGKVSAEVYEDAENIYIDLSDTGKGIPASKFKTVFQPGYTTKTRGWGLGLSLAKRIIEEYHSGKIFVKQSEEGKGTTFTIQLPKG